MHFKDIIPVINNKKKSVNHSKHFVHPRRKGTNIASNLNEYLLEYLYRKKHQDVFIQLTKDSSCKNGLK